MPRNKKIHHHKIKGEEVNNKETNPNEISNNEKGAIGGGVGAVVVLALILGILGGLGYFNGSSGNNVTSHAITNKPTNPITRQHTRAITLSPATQLCSVDGALIPGTNTLISIDPYFINSTTDSFVRGPLYLPPNDSGITGSKGGWIFSNINNANTYNDISFIEADGTSLRVRPLNTISVSGSSPKTVPTVQVWYYMQDETSLYFCGLGQYVTSLPGVGKINLTDMSLDSTFGYPATSQGYMDLTGWTGTWNDAASSLAIDHTNKFLYVMSYNGQIGIAKLTLSGVPVSSFGTSGFVQQGVPLFSNTQNINNRAMCLTPTRIVYFGNFGIQPANAGGAIVWGGLTTTTGAYDRTFAGNGQSANYMDLSGFNVSSYGANALDAIFDPLNNQIFLTGMIVTGISSTNVHIPFVLLLTGNGVPIASFGNSIYTGLFIYLPTTPLYMHQFSGAYLSNGTLYMCYSFTNANNSLEQTTLFAFNNTGVQKTLLLGTGTSSLTFTAFSAVPFTEGGSRVLLCIGNLGPGLNAITPYTYQVCLL